eukprot:CAMPEP_0173391804 /NCGR_PEP_ID=MMETSP1356-20130122/18596_1 /TAXON_ID=77927 ORGANISM="Hemiselmis virescens, Strain PCC157" /NCGR_SAMPLE_ID=MMETSP1356 /ASSEMBLY_ACC=CAM_ASM_000847 /LENGTH=517 /DNA_ID=CAMNT_0014349495 /DNA_START=67 /DNA_END=1616 /DNA_ORIENTATION=+
MNVWALQHHVTFGSPEYSDSDEDFGRRQGQSGKISILAPMAPPPSKKMFCKRWLDEQAPPQDVEDEDEGGFRAPSKPTMWKKPCTNNNGVGQHAARVQPAAAKGGATGTLILTEEGHCLAHKTGNACLECPRRVELLCGTSGILRTGIDADDLLHQLKFENHNKEAPLADLLRVHDWEYLHELISRCDEARRHKGKTWLDPPGHPRDTLVSPESYSVANKGAGAVCAAVDRVLQGLCRNAFVPLRPPGHHAGPAGLVYSDDGSPTESQGFCLINHVAIGAAYARYNYRHMIQRIAIVDFDVHNGNGTAAIVRNLRPHRHTRMISAETSVTYPSYKPWLDETDGDNVFFASIHLSAHDFYPRLAVPGQGRFGEPEFGMDSDGAADDPAHPNIVNIPMGKTSTTAESSELFRSLVEKKLLDRLRSFRPDLIMISAGFDGHHEDCEGNRGWCHLLEEDYEWITDRLCEVASDHCKGRIVSVLEGGYHVPQRRGKKGSEMDSQCVLTSALATSCAAHVRSL